MALPSQSGSRGSARAMRGAGGIPKWIPIAVVAGAVAVLAWVLWPSAGARTPETPGGALAGATNPDQSTPPTTETAPAPTTNASNDAPEPLPSTGPDEASQTPAADDGAEMEMPSTPAREKPSSVLTDALKNTPAPEPKADPTPTTTVTSSAPPPPPPARVSPSAATALVEADRLIERGQRAEARDMLNYALLDADAEDDRARLRARLTVLNDELIFSPTVFPGVWNTERYEIKGGDSLARIASRQDLAVDWRLLQRINRISDPGRIRVGQTLKLVRGPFHAVVDKSDFRLDLYHGAPDEPEDWTFIRSYAVGLGEHNATPVGPFVVRRDSKLVNPRWTNPRTGEQFEADNPENPIGERWIGIEGLEEASSFTGYGIHGTIDPDSIGQERSMGCVRMHDADVEVVYELLAEGVSRVIVKD